MRLVDTVRCIHIDVNLVLKLAMLLLLLNMCAWNISAAYQINGCFRPMASVQSKFFSSICIGPME